MFERFDYLGTEDLLLGLSRQGDGVGAKALEALGITPDVVRERVEAIIGRHQGTRTGGIPFTPHAKKALEFALRESMQLGQNYIGTGHILLGLVREGEGVGSKSFSPLGPSSTGCARRSWSCSPAERRCAPAHEAGEAATGEVIERFCGLSPGTTACFVDDLEAFLARLKLPPRHRINLRTTDLIEAASSTNGGSPR